MTLRAPITPAPRLLWLCAALIVACAVTELWLAHLAMTAELHGALIAVAVLLSGLLLLDGLRIWRTQPPALRQQWPTNVSVGAPFDVTVELPAIPEQPWIALWQPLPDDSSAQQSEYQLRLQAVARTQLKLQLTCHRRGDVQVPGLELKWFSPWRCWYRTHTEPQHRVKVYPNFATIETMKQVALEHQNLQLGVHLSRERGSGTEFRQLRDFRQGDSTRQIDWKATSRRQKLIAREYQQEHNQQVLLLLDCGRRMRQQTGSLSYFDQCLNAQLMLAYTVLKQGDNIAMATFANDSEWTPTFRGSEAISALLSQHYASHPKRVATDYLGAAETLLSRGYKRSLVLLTTQIRDDDLEELLAAIKLLQKQHLVVIANLREQELNDVWQQPVENFTQALSYAGVADYNQQRRQLIATLRHAGALVLDCSANELLNQLIRTYLSIKRTGRL